MYNRDPQKVRDINYFIRSVAEKTTVEAAARACCPGVIVKSNGFISCPSHTHKEDSGNLTHCSIDKAKDGKVYNCFVCGCGGDAVSYVARYNKIPMYRAAQQINETLGLGVIDPIGGSRDSIEDCRSYAPDPRIIPDVKKIPTAERQTVSTIDRVYRAVASVCRPTPELVARLEAERGMTAAEVKRDIISEIPHKLVDKLVNMGIEPKDMIGVPGFFLDVGDGRYDVITPGRVNFLRQGVEYGILVRDPDGNIVGITTRYAPRDGQHCKYGWYSSAKRAMGCSSGTHPGYIDLTPEEWESRVIDDGDDRHDPSAADMGKRGAIVVCEGYHKAAAVHRLMGMRAMYISGIQSSKEIPDYIHTIAEENGYRLPIIVAPDADCLSNAAIMRGTLQLIRRVYDCSSVDAIRIACWNPEHGKGIDDVLREHGAKAIKVCPLKLWLNRILHMMDPAAGSGEWNTPIDIAFEIKEEIESR